MYNKEFKNNPTDKQIVGAKGEDFAVEYLRSLDHKILDRNYYKQWGEIDIVSNKGKTLHFVEVKTVTRNIGKVTYETQDNYRAEDNMHPWKLQRMSRIIQSYLIDKDVSGETEWQFDLITVLMDKDYNLIKIDLLEDIVL